MSDFRTKATTAFLAPGAFVVNRACSSTERGPNCQLPRIIFLAAGISIIAWGTAGWAAWRLLRPR